MYLTQHKSIYKLAYFFAFTILVFSACTEDEPTTQDNESPVVNAESTYTVLFDEDITYASGLGLDAMNTVTEIPLLLDVYSPENTSTNRPVFMFIHGGGFTGGIKHKPEIVEMANYYASRGWVFVSIDYRTTQELGAIQGMTPEEVVTLYRGLAPVEWIMNALEGAENSDQFQQATAMYAAQRDAKAAIRWIVANANTYLSLIHI